ncbi:MAG: copper chaperone PCu(A)C [Anaerolineales bacterium]
MQKISGTLILAVILCGVSACSIPKKISVESAWARPGFQGDNSAIYFTIHNPGDNPDTLIRVESDMGAATQIHLSQMNSEGVMTMEQQDQVPIPGNDTVEFAPGGLHVMLVNLNQDLSVGDTFPLTLTFQNRGEISMEVEVKQEE